MHTGVRTGLGSVCLLLLWLGCIMTYPMEQAGATTYTYVDDKGTVVFTDNKDSIPARYRARVKVMEEGDKAKGAAGLIERGTAAVEQVTGKITGKVNGTATESPFTIGGLSPYQSRVLSLAFVAAVFMAGTMLLSGNPALRFLMRWLLVLLAIGTTATMYFSEGGLAQKATGTVRTMERTQQQKSQQIQHMEPTEKEP